MKRIAAWADAWLSSADWDMPVQYPAGTVNEHVRTRTHAGLFDVSHMGEVDVRGPMQLRSLID